VSRGTDALHVLKVDAPSNTVVVATLERIGRREVELRDVRLRVPCDRVGASFRVRAEAVPAALEVHAGATATLVLDRAAFQVAAGQVAVLYDGDCIVGAGIVVG
jgi:tRNA-specific 2-thiouridylase